MWILFPILILALAGYAIVIYNRLVRDRNRVANAWSDIDVQLKRRHDLIPKLVAAVRQYAKYESATLEGITRLRLESQRARAVRDIGGIETSLGQGIRKLFVLVEDYPELKASESFIQLQDDISEIENHIQMARRYYNGAVRALNIRIESFPDMLLARGFNYVLADYFEIGDPSQRETAGEF